MSELGCMLHLKRYNGRSQRHKICHYFTGLDSLDLIKYRSISIVLFNLKQDDKNKYLKRKN